MTQVMPARMPARMPAESRGFTLLELMVVVVIIGTVVSLAVLGLGDNAARKLDEEANRFASLLRLAADEAVLQGRDIGVYIDDVSYGFHVYDDDFRRWTPMAADALFRKRNMIEGIRLELFLDDVELVLPTATDDDDDEAEDQEEPVNPQVLLLSSGEITPFELVIEFEDLDREVLLRALPNGHVEMLVSNAP
ncbi:MAG: type II secretion system minor pseudopilin GspH [Gammaproteobacteria bacterium]|nr:type II secretion system minor pseudopilin GspH [Gammaproteobacteria bacterium]